MKLVAFWLMLIFWLLWYQAYKQQEAGATRSYEQWVVVEEY